MGTGASNQLLAALPADEMRRLYSELEPTTLASRTTLFEAGSRLKHVYFPVSATVSLLHVMADGKTAEVASVGADGLVDVCVVLGDATSSRAVVRNAGHAYRVPAEALRREFRRGGRLQGLVMRYASRMITHLSQAAACNRHHSVDQQLCRWLLTSLDGVASDELLTTQELIAGMLGVRREGVTQAARALQRAGLIRYSRGRISILSRARLEQRACECYAAGLDQTLRFRASLLKI